MKTLDIPPLTGLRFFAALFVCISHILPRLMPSTDSMPIWYVCVSRLSAEGMTLFFVLSGFVIHYNYSITIRENPKVGIYNFLVARLARLWPLYLVCLFVDILRNYHHFSSLPANFLEAIPYYLTLTQSWFYHPMGNQALIYQFGQMPSVAWSVSTEWFFYLCYPIICFGLLKIGVRAKILAMLAISAITIVSIAALSLNLSTINTAAINSFGPIADFTTHNQDSFFRWLIYFSPYSRFSEFLVGCLIAAIYIQLSHVLPSQKEEAIGLIALAFSILIAAFSHYIIFNPPQGYWFSWFGNLHRCFGFAPSFAITIFCCARYHNAITRFLSFPAILFGGEISYSIYLLHPAIIGFYFKHVDKVINHTSINLLLLFGALFSIATISFRVIEQPARRLLRKWLMIHTPKPVVEPQIS